MTKRTTASIGAALLALVLAACAAGPQAVHWGVEECAHCRMVIGDERFAGQVVDRRGKTYKFDALECMAGWLDEAPVAAADIHSVWISSGRDGWIRAEDATFLHSDGLRSPMGGGYSGHASAAAAHDLQRQVGGEVLSWDQLRRHAADHGYGMHDGHHAGGGATHGAGQAHHDHGAGGH